MTEDQEILTDIGFSRKFSAKLKNVSLTMTISKDQLKQIVKTKTRNITDKIFKDMAKKAIEETRKMVGDYIYKKFAKRIKGSTPITKKLLEVLKVICKEIATDSKYIKFNMSSKMSMFVEFTMFDLKLYSVRTQFLRSMYYRPAGKVLADKNKTSKRKRKLHIEQVYITQTYRQKGGGNKFPGLGWIVEFGRVATGWINPRSLDSNVTPHFTPRIEGQDSNGKAIVNKKRKRRMLLIWDKERQGYVFRPKSRYTTSPGVNAVYDKSKVFDASIEKYAIKTLKRQLEKQTKAGTWGVKY